jgi:hypothetical protein
VLFLADEPEGSRLSDDWCPYVNLFEDEANAVQWAQAEAVAGGWCLLPREPSLERQSGCPSPKVTPDRKLLTAASHATCKRLFLDHH